jgi:hypothetical protein
MPELLEQAGYRLTLLLDKIEELHNMNQEAVVKFMQEKIGAGSMPSLSRWKGDDRRVFSSPVRRKLEVLKGIAGAIERGALAGVDRRIRQYPVFSIYVLGQHFQYGRFVLHVVYVSDGQGPGVVEHQIAVFGHHHFIAGHGDDRAHAHGIADDAHLHPFDCSGIPDWLRRLVFFVLGRA